MNDFMKQIPSSEGDGGSAGEDIPAFCGAWTFTEAFTWTHWGHMLHSHNMLDLRIISCKPIQSCIHSRFYISEIPSMQVEIL
jgi:hypothetical protein